MAYNRSKDYIYEYKRKYLKELGDFPSSKVKARQFIGCRLGSLRKQLKIEKRPRYKIVLRKLINIYEKLM